MAKEFVRFKSRGAFSALVKRLPSDTQAAFNSLLESIVFRNELESYVGGSSDLVDHGTTDGLSDDDHTQYHNDTRANIWFATKDIADLDGKSHTSLDDIGSNTHAQIDTHIGDSTVHFVEGDIDHTAIQNIGTISHANIDNHIANQVIHFGRPDVVQMVAGTDIEGEAYSQNFNSGYAADNTLVEAITDDFTRQYPNSAQNYLKFSEGSARIQLNTSPSTSAHFSWDEPGEMSETLIYSIDFSQSMTNVEFMICWTPDPTNANKGSGYSIQWDGTTAHIYEYTGGSQTTLATQALAMDVTAPWRCEITHVKTGGLIGATFWRRDLSQPGTQTITASDTTNTGGKLGFSISGSSGIWIDSLYAYIYYPRYSAGDTEEIVEINAAVSEYEVILPTPVGKEGYIYSVVKTDSSSNAVNVNDDGISFDFDLEAEDESIDVYSNNAAWRIK